MSVLLRVALFSHTSSLDGAGRSFADLVDGLVGQGCECIAVFPEGGDLANQLRTKKVYVYEYRNRNAWHWSYQSNGIGVDALEYAEALREILFDLVPVIRRFQPSYIVSSTITSPVGLVIAELLNLPSAVSVREYGDVDHDLSFIYGLSESMRAVYESCSSVFCVTQDVLGYHFGIDPLGKCQVIYSNISLNRDHSTQAQISKRAILRSKFKNSGYVVLLPATLQVGKGQLELVEATQVLLQRGYEINCVLAGAHNDPTYMELLKERIHKTGAPDRYLILDFNSDIYSLMKDADSVVSCSRREALSRTLIEASLLGVPIVYASSGGVTEVFEAMEHGLCYEAGNAKKLAQCIEHNLLNPREALERADRAKQHCMMTFTTLRYAGTVLQRIRDDLRRPIRQRNALQELTLQLAESNLIKSWVVRVKQLDSTNKVLREEVIQPSLGDFEFTAIKSQSATKLQLYSSSLVPVSLEQLTITYDNAINFRKDPIVETIHPGFGATTSMTVPIEATIDLSSEKNTSSIRVYGRLRRRSKADLGLLVRQRERELFELRNATANVLFEAGEGLGAQLIKQRTMGRKLLIWGTGTVSRSVASYLRKWQISNFYKIDPLRQDGVSAEENIITLKGLESLLQANELPYIIFATSKFSDQHRSWIPAKFKELYDFMVIDRVVR